VRIHRLHKPHDVIRETKRFGKKYMLTFSATKNKIRIRFFSGALTRNKKPATRSFNLTDETKQQRPHTPAQGPVRQKTGRRGQVPDRVVAISLPAGDRGASACGQSTSACKIARARQLLSIVHVTTV